MSLSVNTYSNNQFVDKLDFIVWKKKIDTIIFKKLGKHLNELEDHMYWQLFNEKFNYKYVVNMIYDQNYQNWLNDFKYYISLNNDIFTYHTFFTKWFEINVDPYTAAKFYQLL